MALNINGIVDSEWLIELTKRSQISLDLDLSCSPPCTSGLKWWDRPQSCPCSDETAGPGWHSVCCSRSRVQRDQPSTGSPQPLDTMYCRRCCCDMWDSGITHRKKMVDAAWESLTCVAIMRSCLSKPFWTYVISYLYNILTWKNRNYPAPPPVKMCLHAVPVVFELHCAEWCLCRVWR